MAPENSKCNIADFFRPSAKSNPPKTIPAKRPSPVPDDELDADAIFKDKYPKHTGPCTPRTQLRVKDTVSSPYKSPFGPRSGASVTIPIRSPKPNPSQTPSKDLGLASPVSRKGGLFSFAGNDQVHDQDKKPLSFADIPTSGQSIVKDGKIVAVRSSDDEDSDSLCSLDDILGWNRRDVPTGSSSPPDVDEEDPEAQRARSLSAFTCGRSNVLVGRDKLRELTSKANAFNFDMSLLVGDHFDDEESEANVTKAKKGYKASHDQEKLKREGLIDRSVLASLVDEEQGTDNVQRLYNAVERTDALATEPTWSMFTSRLSFADSLSMLPFPDLSENSGTWSDCLEDPALRNRAYLSGYVAENAMEGIIRDEIVTWTFNSIVSEPRDDLRNSFVRVVEAARRTWTCTNLTPTLLQQTFCRLGADPIKTKCTGEIRPESAVPSESTTASYSQLISMIEVLSCLAADMTSDALSVFIKLLMRLAIDTTLMKNSHTCVVVEDALSSLLGHNEGQVAASVALSIIEDIGMRIKDPFLQTQTLKRILPNSSTAASLRIHLANLFLFGADGELLPLSNISNPTINLQHLTAHLRGPRYDISRSTTQNTPFNYSTLSSLIYIFDAALADGGRPTTFHDPESERKFNHDVDILADRVRSIITSIADTGASHMRRTEAKEALNALHFRLLYAVRTKPRPKKSVFGGRDGGEYRAEERSRGKMQQFLGRRKDRKERDEISGLRPDLGSLSQKSESEELVRKQLGIED